MNTVRSKNVVKLAALFVVTVILGLVINSAVRAGVFVDNNSGIWSVDFSDNVGISSSSNVLFNFANGTISIPPTETGTVITSSIAPESTSEWSDIVVVGNWTDNSDIEIDLLTCTDVEIPTHQNLSLLGSTVDISSSGNLLDPTVYPCIKIRVELSDATGTPPELTELRATWVPLPVFLLSITGNTEILSGEDLVYTINYSLSHNDDQGVVLWLPLPTPVSGSFTLGYGQDLVIESTDFLYASGGGVYTDSTVTVSGTDVPAGSIYWDLGFVSAGKTGSFNVVFSTENGLEDEVEYEAQVFINSMMAVEVVSDPFITEIESDPEPVINKNVQGTLLLNNINYV